MMFFVPRSFSVAASVGNVSIIISNTIRAVAIPVD